MPFNRSMIAPGGSQANGAREGVACGTMKNCGWRCILFGAPAGSVAAVPCVLGALACADFHSAT